MTSTGKKKREAVDIQTGKIIVFDSEMEKRYYEDIVVNGIKDGSILKYELQKKYVLQKSFTYRGQKIREITYISDFAIWFKNGEFLVVDVKGKPTADAMIKAKMMKCVNPDINFIWVQHCAKHGGWLEYDKLAKIRRDEKKLKNKT